MKLVQLCKIRVLVFAPLNAIYDSALWQLWASPKIPFQDFFLFFLNPVFFDVSLKSELRVDLGPMSV